MIKKKFVIFSDIDGTLMDLTTFDMEPVKKFLPNLKRYAIPLVLCSAKTMAEQKKIRDSLGITDPFIVENGGGIYIPEKYFPYNKLINLKKNIRKKGDYLVLELGPPYKHIRKILWKIRQEKHLTFIGFGDLDINEISKLTGLSQEDAYLAKKREFDETIIITNNELDILKKELKPYNLSCIHGGRFYHIIGKNTSKGRCVKIIINLFSSKFGHRPISIGIGDSLNDVSMLKSVDRAFLVEKKQGGWTNVPINTIKKIKGIGPYGWVNALKGLIQNLST